MSVDVLNVSTFSSSCVIYYLLFVIIMMIIVIFQIRCLLNNLQIEKKKEKRNHRQSFNHSNTPTHPQRY